MKIEPCQVDGLASRAFEGNPAADDCLAVFDGEASVRAITPDHALLGQLTCEVGADRVILCGEAVTFMEAEISFGDRCHDKERNGQET